MISDDSGIDQQLRLVFTRTTPECKLWIVRNRKEIEALRPPNLILLDLMLSSEAPFDVLRWLRTEPRYTHVPVFALGSKIADSDIDEAYALGANSCLLKDSEPQGLEKMVRAITTYVGLIGTGGCEGFA